MPTPTNALPPSLVNELAGINRRLANLERAPEPATRFDRYPAVEWEPIDRGVVADNLWHAASIANVTGLVFDRVETKFSTYNVIKGSREPEIRLAAYRHGRDGSKTIVSASSTFQLVGDPESYLAAGMIRWVHGIPYGWDYATDTDVFTIELQVRYAVGPAQHNGQKLLTVLAPEGGWTQGIRLKEIERDGNGQWWRDLQVRDNGSANEGSWTISDMPPSDTGNAKLSAMQYCVGLPAERIPDATPEGVIRYDLEVRTTRAPDLNEQVMNI